MTNEGVCQPFAECRGLSAESGDQTRVVLGWGNQHVRENPWTDKMPESSTHSEIEVTISNTQGLHARPVMRFVDIAMQFCSSIRVSKDSQDVDGKSPMEMMLLEATQGTVLRLTADGEDARQAIEALARLVNGKFEEE